MVLEDIAKQLEGRYFIFRFSCDWADGEGYAITTVKDGKMMGAYHPLDHHDFAMNEITDEESIQYLKDNGVQEVYTIERRPEYPETFLSYILHYWNKHDPKARKDENTFYHFDGLVMPWVNHDAHKRKLAAHGIELKLLDDSKVISCLYEISTDCPQPRAESI